LLCPSREGAKAPQTRGTTLMSHLHHQSRPPLLSTLLPRSPTPLFPHQPSTRSHHLWVYHIWVYHIWVYHTWACQGLHGKEERVVVVVVGGGGGGRGGGGGGGGGVQTIRREYNRVGQEE